MPRLKLLETGLDANLPAAPVTTMDPVDPNTGTPEQTLLSVLRRIGDIQRQPLVLDNPLAQIGTALSGFAAGVQGKPNPALEEYKADRALKIQAMQHQAQISGVISQIENQRQTREQVRQRLQFDVGKEETNTKEKANSLAFQMGKHLTESNDAEEREHGFRTLQRVVNPVTGKPFLDLNMDPKRLSLMRGKDFDTKWDRAIDMVTVGVDPPVNEYPRDVFPVDQWKQTRATRGGVVGLMAQKRGAAPTESALKGEYTTLSSVPESERTPEMVARMNAIKEGLTLSASGQNTVLSLAKALEDRDKKTSGVVPKPKDEYIRLAIKQTDRSESFERDLDVEADRLNLEGRSRFDWKDQKRVAYQQKIAEVKTGAGITDATTSTAISLMREGKRVATALTTQFTPQERAQFSGWYNYSLSQIRQALKGMDPMGADNTTRRFAAFKALIADLQTSTAFVEAGKALTGIERDVVFGWVPTGKEISPMDFEAKLKRTQDRVDSLMEDRITLATNPRSFLRQMREPSPITIQEPTQSRRLPNGDLILMPPGAK